jgi:hypothetical protein
MPQPERPRDGKPHVKPHENGQADFYLENGLLVFTAAHHLGRGVCCGSGCRHCPYDPPHVEGNRKVR